MPGDLLGIGFMGFFRWLLQLAGWRSFADKSPSMNSETDHSPLPSNGQAVLPKEKVPESRRSSRRDRVHTRARLFPTRRRQRKGELRPCETGVEETQGAAPYRYARYGSRTGHYLDLSRDGDDARLRQFGLPVFQNPEELAEWIGLPLNRVAWLVHRFSKGRPEMESSAHYHFQWVRKRRGGWRLIESPKATLRNVQSKILRELLDKVPVHSNCHGFVKRHSILTNATPHVGHAILLKFDLANFYTTVSFSRTVAIFRGLGYSREAAIWLGLLTTSAVPGNLGFHEQGPYAVVPYLRRHLPQGAPTSPAIANLSAFGLDIRLSGLARAFGATYTRYADDLTISGPRELSHALSTMITLVEQIVRQERFAINRQKRQILRAHQRQIVTGVVVNQRPNVSRKEFDLLKAVLTNCVRFGPSTQNRHQVEDFYHHLQGRIAHIAMLNPAHGEKLAELFRSIDWTR
jgi:RNA-directed DNA polymerase